MKTKGRKNGRETKTAKLAERPSACQTKEKDDRKNPNDSEKNRGRGRVKRKKDRKVGKA